MREALEQVKLEMGEDALVLNHKNVKVGGFLGLGARQLVEIQAAATPANINVGSDRRFQNGRAASKENNSTPTTKSNTGSLSAFAARLYGGTGGGTGNNSKAVEITEANSRLKPVEAIELAPTAPKIVHGNSRTSAKQTTSVAANTNVGTNVNSDNNNSPLAQNALTGELQRLRTELREIKFSLSTFGRQKFQKNLIEEAVLEFDDEQEIYDTPYYEAYLELVDTGLNSDLARRATLAAIEYSRTAERLDRDETTQYGLTSLLQSLIPFAEDVLNVMPGAPGAPAATVFIGPTGVGKTTTIAKLMARLTMKAKQRVEVITMDTYRIAAVDQLRSYAEIIGAGFHVAKSVNEMDGIVRKLAGKATIFVDTAGRSPNDLSDQIELADYLRNNCDLLKCLVLQATTHPLDAQAAIKKFMMYGPDQMVITKLDETTRPGASVGILTDAKLPLSYICAGQRVPEDLEVATSSTLAARILRATLCLMAA